MLNPNDSTLLSNIGIARPLNRLALLQLRDTHWLPWDAPGIRSGRARALCGALIEERDHANAPSCGACQDLLVDDARALDREREP